MRTRLTVLTVAAVLTAAPITASASPPIGAAYFDDRVRAEVVEAGTISVPAGTAATVSSYDLPRDADTGWRTIGSPFLLAVRKGAVALHSADGCGLDFHRAGQALVVKPGRYLIHNTADGPTELMAVGSGKQPLVGGPAAAAPKGCKAVEGHDHHTASGTSTLVEEVTGTMAPHGQYGHSRHGGKGATALAVPAGRDVYISKWTVAPGTTTGWVTHAPALAIITKGSISYIEEHHGACATTSTFTAGQAYTHTDAAAHHLSVVGSDTLEVWYVFVDLPQDSMNAGVPAVGNFLDTTDFTPPPPPGCPRLR